MTRGVPPDGPTADPAVELEALARDWITLWQSELAAAAADREAQESWQAMLALWAGAATTMLQSLPRSGFGAVPRGGFGAVPWGGFDGGRSGADAPPRPAPAAAAPDPRDAEIERLARRVGELEQRLAELERRRRR